MLTSPAGIWELMSSGAERARMAFPGELIVKRCLLAGLPVEFNIVGANLCKQVFRALAHLSVEGFGDRQPALRIDLWDEALAGVSRPFGDLREGFEETTPLEDGIWARVAGGEFAGHQSPRACSVINFSTSHIIGCVASFQALSRSEIGRPLQPILFAWYDSRGIQPVHSGLVANAGDGVLIGGRSGSGKSTTSLLCAQAGFSYLADDYVGIPPAVNGRQLAYSLYASLSLEQVHSRRFEVLRASDMGGQLCAESKLPFDVAETFPDRMARQCTVRAVVLPKLAHISHSRLRPATAAEALLKLAPSSVLQLPFIQPFIALERLAALLRSVPSFWLDLGSDFDSIPLCVAEALALAMGKVAMQPPRGTE